jgi:hypothetical protein
MAKTSKTKKTPTTDRVADGLVGLYGYAMRPDGSGMWEDGFIIRQRITDDLYLIDLYEFDEVPGPRDGSLRLVRLAELADLTRHRLYDDADRFDEAGEQMTADYEKRQGAAPTP